MTGTLRSNYLQQKKSVCPVTSTFLLVAGRTFFTVADKSLETSYHTQDPCQQQAK